MTKAKMLGGALVGAAMALTGCGGVDTSASTAGLEVSTVSAAIDGRTDLFLDPTQSLHLLTADEVNGSPTAVAVEVQVTESELIAWRAQPGVAPALRSRTDADIVGRFAIVGTVDLSTAQVVGNETHTGDPGSVIIPNGSLQGFHGSRTSGGSDRRFATTPSAIGITIEWNVNGIPNAVDANGFNAARAHPGCA